MRRLEIGCGDDPTEGFEHLDCRPLPHVQHVQSAVDLSNFPDETFDVVVAKDIIEHLSWWDVPAALGEWMRVVKAGGHLEVETPNAHELVELIARPHDPGLQRWNSESDWQRFSRVAYGHQDYPENFHGCYFTPEWLQDLLLKSGASAVDTMWSNLFRFRLRATR